MLTFAPPLLGIETLQSKTLLTPDLESYFVYFILLEIRCQLLTLLIKYIEAIP